jgi:conjugal transfer pilus assembly protein TraL
MNERPIPNYVDDQPQIFFWEVDEFLPAVVLFVLFYMWDQILLGMFLSAVFTKFFSRFKLNSMAGVLHHMAWWFGMINMNKRFPNGLLRDYDQ